MFHVILVVTSQHPKPQDPMVHRQGSGDQAAVVVDVTGYLKVTVKIL